MKQNDEIFRRIEEEIPRLRRYALFLTRDSERSDDLIQECLVRAIANIDKWQPGTNLRSWLMTILHNSFINDVKKRSPTLTKDGNIDSAIPHKGNQEVRHEVRDLRRAYSCLSSSHRQIVRLICLEQREYNEVAHILDIPVGTVRSRLCRAREHLRELMDIGTGGSHRFAPQAREDRDYRA